LKAPLWRRPLLANEIFFQRLQRALQAEGKELRIARVDKRKIFGKFYLIGQRGLIDTSVDIENPARKMKLLDPGEIL
jgi:hypothetical protein